MSKIGLQGFKGCPRFSSPVVMDSKRQQDKLKKERRNKLKEEQQEKPSDGKKRSKSAEARWLEIPYSAYKIAYDRGYSDGKEDYESQQEKPKVLFCSGHKKLQRHPNDPIQWEDDEQPNKLEKEQQGKLKEEQ